MDELAINILAKWVERHCVDGHTTVWGSNDVLEDKVHELERGNDYE